MATATTRSSGRDSAISRLQKELSSLQKEPLEGVTVKLRCSDSLFLWEVNLFGPPQTLYESGYFKLYMKFPPNYPFAPPSVRFVTTMFHPNVFDNGSVCISILHPPGVDEASGEDACERWNPTQNVSTILLSIISMLNEPNDSSPANVNAAIMYRQWVRSKGQNKTYEREVLKCVEDTKRLAARDNVQVPTTVEEYLATGRRAAAESKPDRSSLQDGVDVMDWFENPDCDYDDGTDDEDREDEGNK